MRTHVDREYLQCARRSLTASIAKWQDVIINLALAFSFAAVNREKYAMKLLSLSVACATLLANSISFADDTVRPAGTTRTPIKRVIVVVGENVTFDALFATYQPAAGESVLNLRSQGIVNADGSPGPNYAKAIQFTGTDRRGAYTVPPVAIAPYAKLPQPLLTGVFNPLTLQPFGNIPDPRFAALAVNGPFQISSFVKYGDPATFATGDPVHRFFQMWQQTGGNNENLHLHTWVAATAGQGGDTPGVTAQHPGQGGELMGFYNMAAGDAPYFRQLAQTYALSDNYHQAIMGGTGANFFALATGDVATYNAGGMLATPPANQIEDPTPQNRTDNFYTRDGYSGGSYVNCSDQAQPGVHAILERLREREVRPNCKPDAYYLVNNYDPPYNMNGTPKALGADKFVYPPQTVPTIGELLSANGVSWKWYTGGRDAADVISDPLFGLIRSLVSFQVPPGTPGGVIDAIAFGQTQPLLYNSIGDPHNASANVVNGSLKNNLRGLDTLFRDVANGTLPAVSFVVPKNLDSGHPGFSVPAKYELFVKDLIERVQADPQTWSETAILITTDEGGGYFDSGRIQMLDFFGDGPRIPLLAVSPFARRGHVNHVYHDHASILKFIERNWRLPQLSNRSRDNLPNPHMEGDDRYIPDGGPAIGDLMSLFDFGTHQADDTDD
jgi:phospholipase C